MMHWIVAVATWAVVVLAAASAARKLKLPGTDVPEGAPRPLYESSVQPRPPCALRDRRFPAAQPYDLALPEPFPCDGPRTCAEACEGMRDCDAWEVSGENGACQLYSEALDAVEATSAGWIVGYSGGREPEGCVGVYHD